MKSISRHFILSVLLSLSLTSVSATEYPLKEDVSSIDGIISAYYDVISGPKGHVYNAKRDESLHAPGALITRIMDDGTIQRHNLKGEQKGLAGLWDDRIL